jgi:hypothetical protein
MTMQNPAMTYCKSFSLLKSVFNHEKDVIEIPGSAVRILNFTFTSDGCTDLPGSDEYFCLKHGEHFGEDRRMHSDTKSLHASDALAMKDTNFTGNCTFRYSIFVPGRSAGAPSAILLLHGLNERSWEKYLPWALRLVEDTGSAVVLFPLAFHMNRSPVEWANPKLMRIVADARLTDYPSITSASFANAAISSRLHTLPQRFFWTGLQTYSDILQLMRQIRRGLIPPIHPAASVQFFAYSIGAFLSEIVLMTDEDGLFAKSKMFIFCGGPTFDRMYPVSKYIMDSEALISLYAFYVEHLENEFKHDKRLAHYFLAHNSGRYFQAMLSNRKMKEDRETRLGEIGSRIAAVALQKDAVIQPSEVINTLNGDSRDIPIRVRVMDFDYNYSHVNPFPVTSVPSSLVDEAFNAVFNLAGNHCQ